MAVHVESFGHVHGVPDAFDLVLDLRDFIKDPHVSPDLRYSTGQALDVRVHVLAAPGAQAMIEHLVGVTLALLESAPAYRPVRLGLACQSGRHRSVATAEAVAQKMRLQGHGVLVVHHHLTEPVLRASKQAIEVAGLRLPGWVVTRAGRFRIVFSRLIVMVGCPRVPAPGSHAAAIWPSRRDVPEKAEQPQKRDDSDSRMASAAGISAAGCDQVAIVVWHDRRAAVGALGVGIDRLRPCVLVEVVGNFRLWAGRDRRPP